MLVGTCDENALGAFWMGLTMGAILRKIIPISCPVTFPGLLQLTLVSLVLQEPLVSEDHVCSRQVTYYTRERDCAYRDWLSCRYYRYFLKAYFRTESKCCSGYKNVGGRCEPVCFGMTGRQGCSNVGNCEGPDTCRCDSAYRGPQCNNSNYHDPGA
uniref:EGF-like domain-containing protein n=1 Tax=Magallana gigas TaxID=29159 RepID=A0A8W8MEQ2_MAGGI